MSTTVSYKLPGELRTEQDRATRRQADREFVKQALAQLQSSDGWLRWLSTRSLFRDYSLNNQLLIAMQHPDATRVAGFHAWRKLGYKVTPRPAEIPQGRYAIRIWAPCAPTRKQIKAWRDAGSDPADTPRTFFKLASVFAQDQVTPIDGADPVPLEPPYTPITGDSLKGALPRLLVLAEQLDVTVLLHPVAGAAHGFYEPPAQRIVIDDTYPTNSQIATFCHELAHALVRLDHQDTDPKLSYAQEELVAESVSFTCLRSVGVQTDGSAIPYIASWSGPDALGTLERVAGLVDRLAARIETALHTSPDGPPAEQTGPILLAAAA